MLALVPGSWFHATCKLSPQSRTTPLPAAQAAALPASCTQRLLSSPLAPCSPLSIVLWAGFMHLARLNKGLYSAVGSAGPLLCVVLNVFEGTGLDASAWYAGSAVKGPTFNKYRLFGAQGAMNTSNHKVLEFNAYLLNLVSGSHVQSLLSTTFPLTVV